MYGKVFVCTLGSRVEVPTKNEEILIWGQIHFVMLTDAKMSLIINEPK